MAWFYFFNYFPCFVLELNGHHKFSLFKAIIFPGVLLYFMLTGGMPFRAENVSKLKKNILEGTYIIPPYISEDAASLIRAILIGTGI